MGTWLIEWGLILLATWTGIPRASSPRPLTFEDRVRAQEAIERVYYEHRIWPKENPGPKPSFELMISRAQIAAKVEDYLKQSVALDKFWQRPIQPEQLQTEMDRMAKQTKDPETLKELFAALDNDPYLIAECLARPILVERLMRNWYAFDGRFHADAKRKAERALTQLTPKIFASWKEGAHVDVKYILSTENDQGSAQAATNARSRLIHIIGSLRISQRENG